MSSFERSSAESERGRDVPSFIEARPPLITGPGQRPKPVHATNLMDLYECETETEDDVVQVYLRVKPSPAPSTLYDIRSDTLLVTSADVAPSDYNRRTQCNISKQHTFSHIFRADATQRQIFDHAVKGNLRKLTEGHSYTLLTYGASGSGKTYTLMGTEENPGLIPRSLEYIFKLVSPAQHPQYRPRDGGLETLTSAQQAQELELVSRLRRATPPVRSARRVYRRMSQRLSTDFHSSTALASRTTHYVWVSFLEIYNEAVYDLLQRPDRSKMNPPTKLRICEDPHGTVYVKGATQAFVRTGAEAYDVMSAGRQHVRMAATGVHAHSSRSHCIFTITLLSETSEGVVSSYVRLCDLAGSERAERTQNAGVRMAESRAINSSLHVLERCLYMLRRKQRAADVTAANLCVPFRESKLTRLLGVPLSGASREAVSMVVTVNTSPLYAQETRHVLQLAAVASDICVNTTSVDGTTLSETSSMSTVDTRDAEILSLRADNERLHFEMSRLYARLEEMDRAAVNDREESAATMRELVEDAKEASRTYYKQQMSLKDQRHAREIERLTEQMDARIDELIIENTKLKEQLNQRPLEQALVESELEHLQACLAERDQAESTDTNELKPKPMSSVVILDEDSDSSFSESDESDSDYMCPLDAITEEDSNVDSVRTTMNSVQNTMDSERNTVDSARNTMDSVRDTMDSVRDTMDSVRDTMDSEQNTMDSARETMDSIESTTENAENSMDRARETKSSAHDIMDKEENLCEITRNTNASKLTLEEICNDDESSSIDHEKTKGDRLTGISSFNLEEDSESEDDEIEIQINKAPSNNTSAVIKLEPVTMDTSDTGNNKDVSTHTDSNNECERSNVNNTDEDKVGINDSNNEDTALTKSFCITSAEIVNSYTLRESSNDNEINNVELISKQKVATSSEILSDDLNEIPINKEPSNNKNEVINLKHVAMNILDNEYNKGVSADNNECHKSKVTNTKVEKLGINDPNDEDASLTKSFCVTAVDADNNSPLMVAAREITGKTEKHLQKETTFLHPVNQAKNKVLDTSMLSINDLSQDFTPLSTSEGSKAQGNFTLDSITFTNTDTSQTTTNNKNLFNNPVEIVLTEHNLLQCKLVKKIDFHDTFDPQNITKKDTINFTTQNTAFTKNNFENLSISTICSETTYKSSLMGNSKSENDNTGGILSMCRPKSEAWFTQTNQESIVCRKMYNEPIVRDDNKEELQHESHTKEIGDMHHNGISSDHEKENCGDSGATKDMYASNNEVTPAAMENLQNLTSNLTINNEDENKSLSDDKNDHKIDKMENFMSTDDETGEKDNDTYEIYLKPEHEPLRPLNEDIKIIIGNFDFTTKQNQKESVSSEKTNTTDDNKRTVSNEKTLKKSRSLRLRKKVGVLKENKNEQSSEGEPETETKKSTRKHSKLQDIANLQKEFSDVTIGIPSVAKHVPDIPSPEKANDNENVPPQTSMTCPARSTRSRRKLWTPHAENLDESIASDDDGNLRVRIPRPSYHRSTRVRRKL